MMKTWLYTLVGLLVFTVVSSKVRFTRNGYEGLVVAISTEVDQKNGAKIIEGIKNAISQTSEVLFKATAGAIFFRNVKILIPTTWTSSSIKSTAAKGESFEESEIRVDLEHPLYGHRPFTLQYGACGEPGIYIHLTPEFLTESESDEYYYGDVGKYLAGEWAKFRWGVFDEVGYKGDDKYPEFYRGADDVIKVTSCTDKPIDTYLISEDFESGNYTDELEFYNTFCEYYDQTPSGPTSSFLSHPTFGSDWILSDFCDESSDTHPHNSEAPTKQNFFCGKRSVWDVMRKHADFNSIRTLSVNYSAPEFQVVQEAHPNYAVVLDFSGSMSSANRSEKLKTSVKRWILEEVAEGSHVALIRFSSTADVIEPLTKISDSDSRKRLSDSLTSLQPDGGTSIGSGLQKGAEVLTGKKNPAILLLTDGAQNEDPDIPSVTNEVIKSGAKVLTIAFTASADENLESIAFETGGKTFSASDEEARTMLETAFSAALVYQPITKDTDTRILVHDPEPYKGETSEIGDEFFIDYSVGRDLKFRLDTDERDDVKDIQLSTPHGTLFSAIWNNSTKSWNVHVRMAGEGKWTWKATVKNKSSYVKVKVTCLSREPETSPISAAVWSKISKNDKGISILRLFGRVVQDNNAVINAEVSVEVSSLNNPNHVEVVTLRDNGLNPDYMKYDGIYSAYLTKYQGNDRYTFAIKVRGTNETVVHRIPKIDSLRRKRETGPRGRRIEKKTLCCGSKVTVDPQHLTSTGVFERSQGGESVKITEAPTKNQDLLAPTAVTDLEVRMEDDWKPDLAKYNLILKWTAVGDDLTAGIVSKYDIIMTTNMSDVSETSFGDSSLKGSHAINTINLTLLEGGTETNFSTIVEMDANPDHMTYYFALRATDDSNLSSPVSNVFVLRRPKRSLRLVYPLRNTAIALGTAGTALTALKFVFLYLG